MPLPAQSRRAQGRRLPEPKAWSRGGLCLRDGSRQADYSLTGGQLLEVVPASPPVPQPPAPCSKPCAPS